MVGFLTLPTGPRSLVEIDREEDGRWIGEVTFLPGVMAYGNSEDQAARNAVALALRVIGDRIEHGEAVPPEARELLAFA